MQDSERQPLIREDGPVHCQEPSTEILESKQSSLPNAQFMTLCFLRMLDPMIFSQIFPYINEYIGWLHVTRDSSRIALYSGVVESIFAVSQMISVYPWGFLSDIVGRRTVVLIGVAGLTSSTLLFGISRSFTEMLLFRAMAGLFSGNVAVLPSMLCEITDHENEAFAFPFFGLWWPIGAVIGSLIGGHFGGLHTQYSDYLNYDLLKSHPYFFPCFLVSAISFIGLGISYFFLEETIEGKTMSADCSITSCGTVDLPKTEEQRSTKELMRMPIIQAICFSGCSLSFISTAFDVVFVNFCYSPITRGGLGFSPSQIGYALAIQGTGATLLQIMFMPSVLHRFSHAKFYHFCVSIWPYTFLILPILHTVAFNGYDNDTREITSRASWLLWIGLIFVLIMARVAYLAYSINMILVKRYTPSQCDLGSVNGMVQFSICFSRAFSPAIASGNFALFTDMEIFGGYLWAIILALISFGGCQLSKCVVKQSEKCDLE